MNDRELLELAAKAAGHVTRSDNIDVWIVEDDGSPVERWNPLQDDGQALRLAVKLGIEIGNYYQYGRALASVGCTRGVGEFWEINPDDHCAATRRAIVRAAAEIGKTRSD